MSAANHGGSATYRDRKIDPVVAKHDFAGMGRAILKRDV